MVKFGVEGWDTTITVDANGNGEAVLVDPFNGFEILQIIAVPSISNLIYKLQILNNDFHEFVLNREIDGIYNEIKSFPVFGRNVVRIRDAVPAQGTIKIAVRFR